jgi:hypothetical protein
MKRVDSCNEQECYTTVRRQTRLYELGTLVRNFPSHQDTYSIVDRA